MVVSVGSYTIEVEQVVEKGKVWNVCLRRKGIFKRRVSSDWFLDEKQAEAFAKSLAEKLTGNSNPDFLKARKPGAKQVIHDERQNRHREAEYSWNQGFRQIHDKIGHRCRLFAVHSAE